MEYKRAIPTFSKLKAPTVTNLSRINSIKNNVQEKASLGPRFQKLRQPLSRRSKSFSEIQTLRNENFAANQKTPPKRKVLPLISKPNTSVKPATVTSRTVKRTAIDKPTEVKPKVAKITKPAPYDFKARFHLLQEKHTTLLQKYKDLSMLQEQNKTLTEEIEKAKENLTQANNRLEFLEVKYTESKSILEKNVTLTENLRVLSNELTNLKQKHQELLQKNEEVENRTQYLNSNLETAKDRIKSLEFNISTYKSELTSSEKLRRNLHNTCQDLKGRIRVYCRVRPVLNTEIEKLISTFNFADETSLEIRKSTINAVSNISGKCNDTKQDFRFDRVFQPESSQREIFEDLAELVQSALDGYNICVFAYGQTGSGKTYTMLGDEDNKGMIPRTVELLFAKTKHLENIGWKFEIECSFLEIYNESIRDLLNPSNNMSHDIKFNEGKNTIVTNLRVEHIKNESHLKQLLISSQKNRAVAVTDFNEHSSRSHSVTKISVKAHDPEGVSFAGTLNLVDLAGSESAKTSSKERIVETKNINKSLSTLGSVMLSLRNKESHIPYRNSKLTYLLQSSLGGNSKTLMFVNVSPLEENYNETINSLRFAAKVKEVKLGSKRIKTYASK